MNLYEYKKRNTWMNQKKNVRNTSANPMRIWWLEEAILIALPASPPEDGGAAASAPPAHTPSNQFHKNKINQNYN